MRPLLALVVLSAAVLAKNIDFSKSPPGGLTKSEIPRFVMLTFDSAVTITNFPTYKRLFAFKNKGSGCRIGVTYFLSHEDTNYQLVNELHRNGMEIASHSISHKAQTYYWQSSNKTVWTKEIAGMRKLTSHFGKIPAKDIRGHRAPYLQTAGKITFQMLKDEGFRYDSSMPTLRYSKKPDGPIFPYTLDKGFKQDCQIWPCPGSGDSWGDLFIVPMNDLWKMRVIEDGQPPVPAPCAQADACLPKPENASETYDFLKKNWDAFTAATKAPFPLFIHESWLTEEGHEDRMDGFFKFIDFLTQHEDVYLTTINEVLDWMEKPASFVNYKQPHCIKSNKDLPPSNCPVPGITCKYIRVPELNNKNKTFVSCADCPTHYPWVDRPLGE